MQTDKPTHILVYNSTKAGFLSDFETQFFEELMVQRYREVTGRKASGQEVVAWKNSLHHMTIVLEDAAIPPTAGIGIELFAPQSMSRVDFSITGFGDTGAKTVVFAELKQWSSVETTDKDAIVRTALGRALIETLHPSYQAWSYASLFGGFNESVASGEIRVIPCAYLHNYNATQTEILDERYEVYLKKAPVFLMGTQQRGNFREFIRSHIKTGDDADVLNSLIRSKIGASKALADAMNKLLADSEEFVLIGDQKLVFESIRATAKAAAPGRNRVVIVEGGPGTGKSVIAINLLVKLLKNGLAVKYVSKNSSPRHVYKSKLTKSFLRSQFDSLFVGPDSFHKMEANAFDLLLVDEAHRLTQKSGVYGNLGENQVKELINAAKCAVFFIDEDQRVTFKDIGSKEQIRQWAKDKGAEVEEYVLSSQFRCSGSDGYINWLDNVLGIRETPNIHLDTKHYTFKVFDSPNELHAAIEAKTATTKRGSSLAIAGRGAVRTTQARSTSKLAPTTSGSGTCPRTAAYGSSPPDPLIKLGASTPAKVWRLTTSV